jgi:hypothetical protein
MGVGDSWHAGTGRYVCILCKPYAPNEQSGFIFTSTSRNVVNCPVSLPLWTCCLGVCCWGVPRTSSVHSCHAPRSVYLNQWASFNGAFSNTVCVCARARVCAHVSIPRNILLQGLHETKTVTLCCSDTPLVACLWCWLCSQFDFSESEFWCYIRIYISLYADKNNIFI